MTLRTISLIAAGATMLVLPTAITAQTVPPKEDRVSAHLRCDGQPDNMSDGESFARFIGAITLLGLFAPSPEGPDPSARFFGRAGVEACSQVIDGQGPDHDGAEDNVLRRIPLILARAIHRIEMEDYDGAIADAEAARLEATEAGLVGNPYFDRSMGLNFDKVIAEALMLRGDYAESRDTFLRGAAGREFATYPMILATSPELFLDGMIPEERRQRASLARQTPQFAMEYALALDDAGDHTEAAAMRRDLLQVLELAVPKTIQPTHYLRTAMSEALAGEWDAAEAHVARAREIIAQRAAQGNPVDDQDSATEFLDLLDVLRLRRDGDLAGARMRFAGRSQWLDPSFPTIVRLTRDLREGASDRELVGGLARVPEEMVAERRAARRAVIENHAQDNRSLYMMLAAYSDIEAFEDQSRTVWRTDGSRLLGPEVIDGTGFVRIDISTPRHVRNEAFLLHAALLAQARGKEGFVMIGFLPIANGSGAVRFVNRDELNAGSRMFIDAASVIAELSPILPSPDIVEARERERRRQRRNRD